MSFFHRECDVPACHMLSLMWGTGWPALYSHENLADVTHRRGGDLYGATSMHYYRCVYKMVRAGSRPVKYEPGKPELAALPDDYFAYAREIKTPVLLTTGEENQVFTDSNIVCHERLQRARLRPARAQGLPRLRAPGRVHGRGRRARLLPRDAGLHPPPFRSATAAGNGRHEAAWPASSGAAG